MPRPRVLVAVVMTLWVVLMPVTAWALRADPMVTCCCGEHEVAHDCGCADCPGGDKRPSGFLGVDACEGDADEAPPATMVACVACEAWHVIDQGIEPVTVNAPPSLMDRPGAPPDPPPPRQ